MTFKEKRVVRRFLPVSMVTALLMSVRPLLTQAQTETGPIHRAIADAAFRLSKNPVTARPAQLAEASATRDAQELAKAAESVKDPCSKPRTFIAKSFEMLRPAVKTGQAVIVIEAIGQKTTGTLRQLSNDSIEVLGSDTGPVRHLSEIEVREIQIECRDPLWNGPIIGAGAGMLFILPGYWASGGGESPVKPLAAYGAFGAAVGLAIDYMKKEKVTIYRTTDRPSTVAVTPAGTTSMMTFDLP